MVRATLNTGRSPVRRGVTLTEVLVAMFVMAIGMISLLTLFPLGAMQVGQALRDDRATQLARQADAFVRQSWRNEIIPRGGNFEGYYWAMDDPYLAVKYADPAPPAGTSSRNVMRYVGSPVSANSWYNSVPMIAPFAGFNAATTGPQGMPATANNRPTTFTLTDDAVRSPTTSPPTNNEVFVESYGITIAGPSFPVWIDPAGVASYAGQGAVRGWVAQSTTPGFTTHPNGVRIPRRTCQLVNKIDPYNPATAAVNGPVSAFELTTLVDDMTFLSNGAPSATELGRQGRYSWAAVIQRPFNEHRSYVDLSILVFDKRPALPQAGDELVIAPDKNPVANAAPALPNDYLAGTRTVRITLPNRTGDTSPVLLRRGGWVIDGTIDTTTGTNTRRNFFAYRVSGFTEVTVGATTTTYDVDLETPLRQPLSPLPAAAGDPAASQLYLFAGLIEVFARPQLRPDTNY